MLHNDPLDRLVLEEAGSHAAARRSSYLYSQRDVQPPTGQAETAFRRGSVLTSGVGSPLRRISSAVAEELNFTHLNAHLSKLHPLVTEIDRISESSESSSPRTPQGPAKILMLHGYTQSGEFFYTKSRKIREGIISSIEAELSDQYPQGVEFFYPDAPILDASDRPGYEGRGDLNEDLRGWFDINDMEFRGLEEAVVWLAGYMREIGPIDGIIGFSQGAALASMLSSLCEGDYNKGRLEALAKQPVPIHVQPPQGHLKFFVALSGFRSTIDNHVGFYNPIITTPAMCVIGDLDIMVSEDLTTMLVGSCFAPEVIHHKGGHYVPTDKKTIDEVVRFVTQRMHKDAPPQDNNDLFRDVCF